MNQDLTLRDLEIFHHHEIMGKTLNETADIVGVSRETIKRTKHKQAYNELAIQALQNKAIGVEKYAEKVAEQLEAKKSINIAGKEVELADNNARIQAIKEVGSVYGLYAPKAISLHSIASIPDEDLALEVEQAAQDRLGGKQREQIAGEGNTPEVKGAVL
jgi:hypothetical protein